MQPQKKPELESVQIRPLHQRTTTLRSLLLLEKLARLIWQLLTTMECL